MIQKTNMFTEKTQNFNDVQTTFIKFIKTGGA